MADGLQRRARSSRVTPSTLVQAAWALLLGHFAARPDVVFGAAFSGRPAELEGVETLVGPCVNNVPVRVRIDADRPVSACLADLHGAQADVAQHQYASLADIQRWAGVPWRSRLFDSLVVFQNYLVDDAVLDWGPVTVAPEGEPEQTAYPLTLTVTPRGRFEVKVAGRGAQADPDLLARVLSGLTTLLEALAGPADASLRELQALLDPAWRGSAAAAEPPRPRPAAPSAPAGETERVVAEVWQELFGLEQIGVEENFFDLGGQSILLVQAHERLRERLGVDLPVVALLQFPTIRSLARHLSGDAADVTAISASQDRAAKQRQALARQRQRIRRP